MSREQSERGPKSKRSKAVYAFTDLQGVQMLNALIVGMALDGGAIRVGLTRDGGALAIGVYAGDEYGTEYVKPDEDLGMAVREIAQAWGITMAFYDDTAGMFVKMR